MYLDVTLEASPKGSRLQHKVKMLLVLHSTDEADKPEIFFDLLKTQNL